MKPRPTYTESLANFGVCKHKVFDEMFESVDNFCDFVSENYDEILRDVIIHYMHLGKHDLANLRQHNFSYDFKEQVLFCWREYKEYLRLL